MVPQTLTSRDGCEFALQPELESCPDGPQRGEHGKQGFSRGGLGGEFHLVSTLSLTSSWGGTLKLIALTSQGL